MREEKQTIGILLSNPTDRRLLVDFVTELGYQTYIPPPQEVCPGGWKEIDLIIADEAVARRCEEVLLNWKRRSGVAFRPLLILLSPTSGSDDWLAAGFDDALRIPLAKADLYARLNVLLHLREQSQELVHRSEMLFHTLVEQSPVGVYMLGTEGFLHVNQAMAEMFGYRPEEIIGRLSLLDLVHPDDHQLVREALQRWMDGERASPLRASFRGRRRDGATIYCDLFTTMVECHGRPVALSTLIDITEHVREERASARRRAGDVIVSQIYKALALGEELEPTLETAFRQAEAAMGNDVLGISLWSEEGEPEDRLLRRIGSTPGDLAQRIEELLGLDLRRMSFHPMAEGGFVRRAVAERKALLFDTSDDLVMLFNSMERLVPPARREAFPALVCLLRDMCRSVLIAPLVSGEQVLGLLDLGSTDRLEEADRLWFERLATQISIAIEYAYTRERERKLQEYLSLVWEIGRRARAILDVDLLLQEVVRAVQACFGYHDVVIILVDEEAGELVLAAEAGNYAESPWHRKPPDPERGVIDWVVLHGKTLLVNDVRREPRYVEVWPETRAELCVPIKQGDRVLGVLNIESPHPDAFDPTDVTAMETLADHLAAAIENAQLYERAQREIEDRKQVERSLRQLTQAVEQSANTIVITDLNGDIVYVNPKFEETTGYTAAEALGQNPRILKSGEQTESFYRQLWETITAGQEWRGEFCNKRKDGSLYWEQATIAPVHDETGQITHFIAVKEDVTARKVAEEDLQRYISEQETLYAVASAAAASLVPDELLSTVLDVVLPVLDATVGWIALPGPTLDDPPRIVAQRGLSAEFVDSEESRPWRDCPICAPLLDGMAAWTKPMSCAECSRLPGEVLERSGMHSHVGIPLRVSDRTLGVLNVGWDQERFYAGAERELLIAIGRQVGLALYNAQLYQQARQVDRLQVINELDHALAATLDPDAVVETTLRQIAAALDAPMGAMFIISPCGTGPGKGAGKEEEKGDVTYPTRVFVLSKGWIEVTATKGDVRGLTCRLPDGRGTFPISGDELEALFDGHVGLAKRWGAHGFMIPIFHDRQLVSMLGLGGRPAGRPFLAEDMALALAAADRAGQAIWNAYQHQAAIEAEARYRELYHGVPVGLYRTTPEGRILSANRALVQVLGYPDMDTLLAINVADLYVNPDDRRQNLSVIEQGEVSDLEIQLRRYDGSVIWVQSSTRAVRDESGRVVYHDGSLTDITERKWAEDELRRSQARLAEAQRIAHLGNWDWDIGADSLWWSDETYRIFGLHPQEFPATYDAFLATIHPDDREMVERAVEQALRAGRHYSIDHRILLPDGSERVVHEQGEVIFDEAGRPVRMMGTTQDVTERVRVEQALRESETRLQRRSEELETLYRISLRLNAHLEKTELLALIVEQTVNLLGAEGGGLYVYDPQRDELVISVATGDWQDLVGVTLRPGEGLSGKVFESRRAMFVEDYATWADRAIAYEKDLRFKAVLAVPLLGKDGVLGVLGISGGERKPTFDEHDVWLAELLAAQAAVALENVHLYRALQDRVERLAALNEINTAVVSSLETDVILQRILDAVCQTLDAEEGSILLREPSTGELYFAVVSNPDSNLFGHRLSPGQGIAGWVAQNKRPVYVNDVRRDARFYVGVDTYTGFETRSLLCVPLVHHDKCTGVIQIVNKRQGEFSQDDLDMLVSVAAMAMVALENARLYADVRAQADRLKMLNELGMALSATLDRNTVVLAALSHVRRLFFPQSIALIQPDPHAEGMYTVQTLVEGSLALVESRTRLQPKECVVAWAMEHRQAMLVTDVRANSRRSLRADHPLGDRARALMVVPLTTANRTIGVLEVICDEPNIYTQADLNTLQTVVSALTVALENVSLYEEQKDLLREREHIQVQLIHSEKMSALGRLVASLAHEINNPLQAVGGCLTLIQEELEGPNRQEKLDRYLEIASSEVERVSGLVRRMRGFYRQAREGMQPTDLHDVLESVLALTHKQLQHSSVTLEQEWATDELPPIWANPDQLKQVFLNLVLNAIDAMPGGGTLYVRTRLADLPSTGAPGVCVEFTDTGEGIPSEVQDRVFEPFFTTKKEGSGLGLSISHGIITAHGGQITVESQEGMGTTFTVLLPVEKAL